MFDLVREENELLLEDWERREQRLGTEGDNSKSLVTGSIDPAHFAARRALSRVFLWTTALLAFSFVNFSLAYYVLYQQGNFKRCHDETRRSPLAYCKLLAQISQLPMADNEYFDPFPAPVLNHIELPFSPKQLDARRYTNQSIYVGIPGPEVDQAWNRISDELIFGITYEDVVQIGKNPQQAISFNPVWGLGDNLYMAEVDVFHQIHCLNTLRKALVTNYDYYWGSRWGFEPPIDFQTHLRHCTSMLLQNLMCHADAEVITHEWREDQPWPFPDFGVVKQCRDFDAFLDWAGKADIEDSHGRYMEYRPPNGSVRIPKEDGTDEAIGAATGYKYGTETQEICIMNCNI